jgi:ubiquinone biosynthesis monooxygenase Coq7
MRDYGFWDRLLIEGDRALRTLAAPPTGTGRANPGAAVPDTMLDAAERRHAAGLMRINHSGEVCAQALYFGHAAFARKPDVRADLMHAADEEGDHLVWCSERLGELGSRPSVFNPLWYAGAWAMGAGSALVSDAVALGFVGETERQVEAHLADHDQRLPAADQRSRAILKQMRDDEVRHGQHAMARGGVLLPFPVPTLMQRAADLMRTVVYRW